MIEFKNGNFQLGKEFMLEFQQVIRHVIPNIWTFLRQAMLIKYGIDIGPTKAPLGNTHTEWKDSEVIAISEKLESIASAIRV